MRKTKVRSQYSFFLPFAIFGFILLVSCGTKENASTGSESNLIPQSEPALLLHDITPSIIESFESTPTALKIIIQSNNNNGNNSASIATLTPQIPPTLDYYQAYLISPRADPLIFTEVNPGQICGKGEVVSFDGHTLRGSPKLLDDRNFLELLPEGSIVELIDCRLWIDENGFSWIAVRTETQKLGWMLIQPDKFLITLFPIPIVPPRALTGIPAGTMVAYTPPSRCNEGPNSVEATATSIGIDLIPIVGDLKGLSETATGCDLITGEDLGNWRWFGLLGIIGLSEIALLRHSDEAVTGVRIGDDLIESIRYSDEAALLAAHNADNLADYLRYLDEFEGSPESIANIMQATSTGHRFSDEMIVALARIEQPCSFSFDTPVWTEAGPTPIELVQIGDLVLAYNEAEMSYGYYKVINTFSHVDHSIVSITIGQETIVTTIDHPFFSDYKWVPSGNLEVGDKLMGASYSAGIVRNISHTNHPQVMYNLTVDNAHTYVVGMGRWLVHNACSQVLRQNIGTPSWADEVQEWQAHHIIPGEWENHPFLLRASDGGWQIDNASNGIALPKLDEDAARLDLPSHRGPHNNYSAQVRSELDTLETRAIQENWDTTTVLIELDKLISRLRKDILSRPAGSRLPI